MMAFLDTRPRLKTVNAAESTPDSGDVIGGLQEIEVTPGGQGTTGRMTQLNVIDDSAQAKALTIYFFDEAPTTIADDAAFSLDAANIAKICGVVDIETGDYRTIGSERFADKKGADVQVPISTPTIYAYVVITGTATYAAGALKLRMWFERD